MIRYQSNCNTCGLKYYSTVYMGVHMLHLALMEIDVDLEGLRVLVDGVLPTMRMIRDFPAKRLYQTVGSMF